MSGRGRRDQYAPSATNRSASNNWLREVADRSRARARAMRVASENHVPVAARAALTRAVAATDAQLSRTRTLERGEVVQTHALFRRIRHDGHRRRARRDSRATRRDARAGHRRRSLEGHLRHARIHARTRARQSSRTSQNDHTHHETPFPRPRSSPPPSRGRPASPRATAAEKP